MADASIDVECPAARAWELLTDLERVPAWVPGVAEVELLERGPDGRARLVQFVTMPSTGSLVYRVRYQHDEAERTQRWSSVEGDERGLDGAARILDLGDGRCRLHYQLSSWAGRAVPRWAQAALATDTPQRTVDAFKRWAEARPR
ncbi:MAG TPA: SRPBCC family protein [Kofleriaceae bacterium]|nr:SRPBCC family protein [Kofleriaceae bacterium]